MLIRTNKTVYNLLLPLLIIAISIAMARWLIANKPQAERRTQAPVVTQVDATLLVKQNYQLFIKTNGTVEPSTESTLIPEVSGRIIKIFPHFREGEFFEKDEALLQIDPRDYEIAISVAQAQLAQAKLAVEEEKARAEVAERQWKELSATKLALRKPHLAAARAALLSAQAQLKRAHLDLQRTRIIAPYAGRVLEQNVDLGQYVAPGSTLARVYAVDYVEIRLPLTNLQLEFVDLPERYRNEPDEKKLDSIVEVTIRALIGRNEYAWHGKIVRTEGAIDTKSRQLFVVAQIKDPYSKGSSDRPPLRVGQFVEAYIKGNLLQDVYVIPISVLRPGNEVLLIKENKLIPRVVRVAWRDEKVAVISRGLQENELLSLTSIAGAVDHFQVTTEFNKAAPKKHRDQLEPVNISTKSDISTGPSQHKAQVTP